MQRRGFLFGVLLAACAHGKADYVDSSPFSGSLVLSGDEGAAMRDAKRQMTEKCGNTNYSLTQDWRDETGQHHVAFQCNDPGSTTSNTRQ